MKAQGFTLLEVVIVMVIVGILTSLAAPSFNQAMARQELRTQGVGLQTALLQARTEAAKRGVTVTLSSAEEGWANGWLLIANDGQVIARAEDTSLLAVSSNVGAVTYLPSGRIRNNTRVRMELQSQREATLFFCVITDAAGRPVSYRGGCG